MIPGENDSAGSRQGIVGGVVSCEMQYSPGSLLEEMEFVS